MKCGSICCLICCDDSFVHEKVVRESKKTYNEEGKIIMITKMVLRQNEIRKITYGRDGIHDTVSSSHTHNCFNCPADVAVAVVVINIDVALFAFMLYHCLSLRYKTRDIQEWYYSNQILIYEYNAQRNLSSRSTVA